MKIVIPGGSGYLGSYLASKWIGDGHEVFVLSRGSAREQNGIRFLNWNGEDASQHTSVFEGADLVLNLTGKSVDCRHNEANKKLLLSSRVNSTRAIGEVLSQLYTPVKYWMNASAATIYPDSYEDFMTEETELRGGDFSAEICKRWEEEFFGHDLPQTKRIVLRITLILGFRGGVLPVLSRLARFGMAGKNGSGKQFFSWMHEEDVYRSISFMMENGMEGPVNMGSPNPLTDAAFNKKLRKAVGMPIGFPKPKFALAIGGALMGTEPSLVLKSTKVLPKALLDAGFKFSFPEVDDALSDLIK